jgi:hypothetical protein
MRLRARAQWRQSPRYQRLAAGLSTIGPSALRSLVREDRQILRWYYGLGEQRDVLDQNRIATRTQLSRGQVEARLHRLAARLLGPRFVHAAGDRVGTTAERCTLCRSELANRQQ